MLVPWVFRVSGLGFVMHVHAAIRSMNNSFVHGAAALSVHASTPFVHHKLALIVAGLICVYAGWFHRAYLASFLGGIIVAVVVWTAIVILSTPELGIGVFVMVPFALSVILPIALAAYVVGRVIFTVMHQAG